MRFLRSLLYAQARGGLTMYWAIMIGVIIMSGYLVGGLVPKRLHPKLQGQPMAFTVRSTNQTIPALQLRSINFQGCRGFPAILFLLDSSEGMRNPEPGTSTRKIDSLKTAILTFTAKLTDKAIVGIMSYSDPSANDPKMRFPFTVLNGNRPKLEEAVAGLDASGLSYFREGMEKAREELGRAQAANPQYQFSLVVVSDTIPQTAACIVDPTGDTCTCRGTLCWDASQDPTQNPNVAQDIRNMGVNIYTLEVSPANDAERLFASDLTRMLKDTASSPKEQYFKTLPSVEGALTTFDTIGTSICL